MIKVLQIRETPLTKCAGIDANCQGLISLFEGDDQIDMLPTMDYTRHTDPFIHQYWLDEKEICASIEKYNPDIVHIHGAYSFTLRVAVKCAKKYGKPIAFSGHFHPFYALKRPFMGKLFFNCVTRNALKKIDLVFTINNEDTAQMSPYNQKVIKLPHWSKFEKGADKVKKVKNMILFVGRLTESNKGLEHLYHLPEGKFEIHLVGKGDVELRSDMIKHVNISDEELKALYQKASLLVVPSRYEAFSYVSIEALMCNTPVVMSDRVRIADHLDGISGYSVFKYHDFDGFVKAVESTIGKTVETNKVRATFDPIRIKKAYKEAYLSVVNNGIKQHGE